LPTGRRIAAALAAWAVLAAGLAAQNSRWADPYQDALKAINAKNYQRAATLLEQAVAAEPRAAANKYVEGVFRIDYFPYYYLGVAYLELHQYDKAQANFQKAKTPLSRDLTAKLDQYQKRLTTEMAANNPSPPGPIDVGIRGGRGPGGGGNRPAVNPAFDGAARTADAALAAKRFAEAVTAFDAAKAADAAEFTRQNLQAKRDEAARGVQGQQLADEGRQLLSNNQIAAAEAKLQQADQALPGQKTVADGLAEVRQRKDRYQALKGGAENDINDKQFQAAIEKLNQAKTAAPDLFATDRLEARASYADQQLKNALSQPPGKPGDRNPVQNTPNGGGAVTGGGTTKPALEDDRATLRAALVALLRGKPSACADTIEAAFKRPDANVRSAPLHAYLGVAYATQALSLPAGDAADRLRERALTEFRAAIAAQRSYRLSERIVSPKILELFEQARRG